MSDDQYTCPNCQEPRILCEGGLVCPRGHGRIVPKPLGLKRRMEWGPNAPPVMEHCPLRKRLAEFSKGLAAMRAADKPEEQTT